MRRAAAYTTRAPSAAVGNKASTPGADSITATTHASAVSEYSCVRLPTASPRAVRVPLELTGNPCESPAATLHSPTALSSTLASTASP